MRKVVLAALCVGGVIASADQAVAGLTIFDNEAAFRSASGASTFTVETFNNTSSDINLIRDNIDDTMSFGDLRVAILNSGSPTSIGIVDSAPLTNPGVSIDGSAMIYTQGSYTATTRIDFDFDPKFNEIGFYFDARDAGLQGSINIVDINNNIIAIPYFGDPNVRFIGLRTDAVFRRVFIYGQNVSGMGIDDVMWATTTPEPSTWAMLVIGFGGIGGAMRSRRRSQPVLWGRNPS